jgi:large subunit ribosomal protein L17
MRHLNAGRKLNRSASHRRALFRNLVTALFERERIRTTDAKAKEVRRLAERMITLGKDGSLAARRRALSYIQKRAVVAKLFSDIAPRFTERPGGYTRIIKLGIRHGDAAPISVLQLTTLAADVEAAKAGEKKKKPARRGAGRGAKAASDAGKADTALPAKPSRKRAAG